MYPPVELQKKPILVDMLEIKDNQKLGGSVVFGLVNDSEFSRRVYVITVSDDHKLDRFFLTRSGSRSYFNFLTDPNYTPRKPEDAPWGWESYEELKAHIGRRVV